LYDIDLYDKGIVQVCEYLKRANMKEGYLLFFSKAHQNEVYETEEIEGKKIHTWIIPIKVKVPSEV